MRRKFREKQKISRRSRIIRSLFLVIGVLVIVILAAGLIIYFQIRGSLPALDDVISVDDISGTVEIRRDQNGVPLVTGSDRSDIAFALGFIHAQERFFQMDLMRRRAAGELAALFGSTLVGTDRSSRIHQFRERAYAVVHQLPPAQKDQLRAYVRGVNKGLNALRSKPYEYLALRTEPEPWLEPDCILVVYAMFLDLSDGSGSYESTISALNEALPSALADFLAPVGCEWDSPVRGEPYKTPDIPASDIFDLRKNPPDTSVMSGSWNHSALFYPDYGSNNWAVAGSRTADGKAIMANDMHLGISVPNTWYRASLRWKDNDSIQRQITGVTLPGAPAIIAGSNTHIAWGFTNSYGDWTDLVKIETDPSNPEKYRTPDGYRHYNTVESIIKVRGAPDDTLTFQSTIWGPVTSRNRRGHPRALCWTAHDPDAVNFNMLLLEKAETVKEALAIANTCGIPPQNFVCVDEQGHIGWTIIGKIPARTGYSGRTPVSRADGTHKWDGWLAPEQYPRIYDPPSGIIWTANARVADGDMLTKIGDGGYMLGARASQIKKRLSEISNPGIEDMLAIQLDDEAIFLRSWYHLLLGLLTPEAVQDDSLKSEFQDILETTWTGRASINSTAYRLVRYYRTALFKEVYGWFTSRCEEMDAGFNIWYLNQWEMSLWRLIENQPMHLLHSRYESWSDLMLAMIDSTISHHTKDGKKLSENTWGERNTTSIRHPLTYGVPGLSRWLNMPEEQLPGDVHMPRVQGRSFGASERFAVSPGFESEACFHMPCGQSGHFMSPYYDAGHSDWAKGVAAPFLPGEAKWTLILKPAIDGEEID